MLRAPKSQRSAAAVAVFVLTLGLSCPGTLAATLHTDDFQTGTLLGWEGGAPRSLISTGGPEGDDDAFLQVLSLTNLATFNSLPEWTGDYGGIEATRLTVDLMNASGSESVEMRVVLFGPGSTSVRWTSATAQSIPADGVWRNYEFSLTEADLALVQGAADYEEMIGDVTRVMLRHDPGTPSAGGTLVAATIGIDNVTLSAQATVPGDYDADGDVDIDDYLIWRSGFGGTDLAADGNNDGVVDAADYSVWRDNLLAMSTVSAGSNPAPEPTPLLPLTFIAAAAGLEFRLRPPRSSPLP